MQSCVKERKKWKDMGVVFWCWAVVTCGQWGVATIIYEEFSGKQCDTSIRIRILLPTIEYFKLYATISPLKWKLYSIFQSNVFLSSKSSDLWIHSNIFSLHQRLIYITFRVITLWPLYLCLLLSFNPISIGHLYCVLRKCKVRVLFQGWTQEN